MHKIINNQRNYLEKFKNLKNLKKSIILKNNNINKLKNLNTIKIFPIN